MLYGVVNALKNTVVPVGILGVALAAPMAFAGEGDGVSCMISNTSFELGPGLQGNPVSAWSKTGNVGLGSTLVTHGQRAAWLAGPFTGGADASTLYKHAECYQGWQFSMRVDVGHASDNPIEGAARLYMIATWMDDSANVLEEKYITLLNSALPTDQMTEVAYTFEPAPAGTTNIRVAFSFNQTAAQESGRAWIDTLSFTRIFPVVNQWGDFQGTTLSFGGYTWRVKNGYHGPGPNTFSDSTANAAVNADGELIMNITQVGNQWRCSEIVLENALGYGTYRFKTNTRMDQLDPNVIFSPFIWEYPQCYSSDTWWNSPNEFDIEFSRWGDSANWPAQYAAQPWDWPGNVHRFDLPATSQAQQLTSQFEWTPHEMICNTWLGHADAPTSETLIHSWTYTGPHLPRPEQPRVHMNMWLLSGEPPQNGQPSTVVVSAFDFQQYAAPCPADINGDGVVDGGDLGQMLSQWGSPGSADINQDNTTDGADLGLMLGAWGLCAP